MQGIEHEYLIQNTTLFNHDKYRESRAQNTMYAFILMQVTATTGYLLSKTVRAVIVHLYFQRCKLIF